MRSAWRHDIDYSKRKREPGILTGVRTICRYMKIGPQTFYKLQMEHDLPVMQLPDGRWCTSRNLLDDWIISRWKAQKAGLEPPIVEGEDVEGVPLLDVTDQCAGALQEPGGEGVI
jgi:hypothetical protein